MIRLLGFIVFFLASNAFADTLICSELEDSSQKRENCNQGEMKAQQDPLSRGMRAYLGKDEAKDYAKALSLFLEAAKMGKTRAYELLADMYANGEGTKQDYTESAKWHRKAANNGKHNSAFALGNFYLLGKGVKKNEQQAFTWFKKAGTAGDKRAYLILGLMYDKGTGTKKNPEKAFNWFQKSAKTNNASGQYYTGAAYIRSKGVKRDLAKGIDWLKKSKKNGHAKAEKLLLIAKKMQKREIAKISTTKVAIEETIPRKENKAEKKAIADQTPAPKTVSKKPEIKKTSKQYPRRATVFAPSSNVRRTPGRRVICSIDTVRIINIGRYENGWYATDACGKRGYIHKSQIRILR